MGCEQQGAERCELCGAPAAVHCAADAAFLCAACDARVHGANFLASRHRRTLLAIPADVQDDDDDEGYESASTSSSSCVSTADSAPRGRRTRRPRAEAVLEGWAKRMGVSTGSARRRVAAAAARAGRGPGFDVATRVPPRVAMAAALWWEVAAGGGCGGAGTVHGDDDALRRLEACARVPARLILAVASSVARARARRRAADVDGVEGWDEC